MTTQEKIQSIKDNHWSRNERPLVAKYLMALHRNNQQVIGECEAFGGSPRHIIMNMYAYQCAVRLGFTDITFNEHGWLESPEFLNREHIEFFDKGEKYCNNEVDVGMGKNGVWVYSISYSTGSAGGYSSISVFDKQCATRLDAVRRGCQEILGRHGKGKASYEKHPDDCGNFKPAYSKRICEQIEKYLNEIDHPKPIQVSLFDV